MKDKIRAIAIYLPQFHPIPENDLWWEKGFTEWTNVAKARPRFKNHYQPHLPADLGFYDLRVEETRIAQAKMAKDNGIYGFCYYHYWFNGRRILERPFQEVLDSQKPDFPFCLCWANETWSRTWDGSAHDYLLKQEHNFSDDYDHMKFLCKVFKDPRYIRVDGKPLFIVYRTELFPDIQKTVKIWRECARQEDIGELYLCYMERSEKKFNPESIGFDAAIEFQPDNFSLPQKKQETLFKKVASRIFDFPMPYRDNMVFDYANIVSRMLQKKDAGYKLYRGVTPAWDNSARKKRDALIFKGSTPELYQQWLDSLLKEFVPYSKEENFIFINAWNEWAEGNHLEPCQKWGSAYLEATKNALLK